jgi:hypothetical protein
VGELIHRSRFEAIRYPSATGKGENLAIFPDCLLGDSHVTPAGQTPIFEDEIRTIIDTLRE